MKICIIAEGCYPYVVGGVSSWIQSLITSFPEYEFSIYAISADVNKKGIFKYSLPSNLVSVQEFFIDEILTFEGTWGKSFKSIDKYKDSITSLLKSEDIDWSSIFNTFITLKSKYISKTLASDYLRSKNFFNRIVEAYSQKYDTVPFTDLFWTVRSIYLPLFYILSNDLPKADLYHSVSTGYAGIVGSLCKYVFNKPFIVSEHGIYTREREEEIIKSSWVDRKFKDLWINFFYSISDCTYSFADNVFALFEGNRTLQVELGCPYDKTKIIPNGIAVEKFRNLPTTKGDEEINVGAIVRVVPIKDIITMLHCFDLVRNSINNVNFYIIGPTDEDEEYFNECISLKNSLNLDRVTFTGTVNVLEYINNMDILVLSSISEGQPLSILEGMAASKPHVATNVGSVQELLYGNDDNLGTCGFVVPIMDFEGMANSIIKLCNDIELRNKMGKIAYKRVNKLYTKDMMINSYRAIYQSFDNT